MSAIIKSAFPYEEIRRPDGDYFQSWKEAKDAGCNDTYCLTDLKEARQT